MGHHNIALAAARRVRGSHPEAALGSKPLGEKCFDVPAVTMQPMPITMHQKTRTTRSIRSGIGTTRRKRHRKQPQAAEMAAHALSGHTRVGGAWGGQSH